MSKLQKQGAESSLAGILTSLKTIEFNSQKINVVGKGIVKIGNPIPPQYKDVKVLYFSRNNLKSLDNVQQFTNLRAFSAADNLLPSFSSVASLQALTALEAVSLDGNPLTDLPNYRHRIISLLSNSPLHQLDGKAVTLEDREMAATVCAVEDAMLSLAVSTTSLIIIFKRAHLLWNIHNEMNATFGQREDYHKAGGKYRQKCISRLVSYFERERRVSLELNDIDFKAEKQEIEDRIINQVISWHEKALKSSGGGGKCSALSWHMAFCRILADLAAQLEELVRSTAAASSDASEAEETNTMNQDHSIDLATATRSDITNIVANIFVSIRQAFQRLSKLRPGIDTNAAKEAEEMRKRVIELQSNLVLELNNTSDSDGSGDCQMEDDGFNTWLIPAGTGTATGTAVSPAVHKVPRSTPNKLASESLTLAAQHLLATESVARLERSIKIAEMQAEELSQKLATTVQKAESMEAENQLLRQEQGAAKQANAALQHWLENANTETEAAKKQIEILTENLCQAHEMHAVEVEKLQSQKEFLQRQVEETETMLRSSDALAQVHENALVELKSEFDVLQQHEHFLEGQLEAALQAAEVAAQQQMQPIKLEINVFLARELELEKARNVELREEAAAVAAKLEEVLELQKQQKAAAEEVLLAKTARKAELERLEEYGINMQARRIAADGLAAWRLAAQRSKKLTALDLRKTKSVCFHVFSSWNSYTKSASLLRTLNTAAVAAARFSNMQKMFAAWRSTCADLKHQLDAELPDTDPRVHLAIKIVHSKYMMSSFQAWRHLAQAQITNNEALVVFSTAHREAENLKEAFALWREATEIQREESHEISCGIAARKVVYSRQVLRAWQRATRRATALAIAEAAATRASKRNLLAKTLAVWIDYRNKSVQEAAIIQEKEEFQVLEALQQEIALHAAEQKADFKALLASRALQRHIFSTWRTEVAYNKHIDAISAWCASSMRRQMLLKSLGTWRAVVKSDQVEELAQQLGQAEASLRIASSEKDMKEQEIEDVNASRLQALSRVEELEDTVAQMQQQLAAAAEEASLLEERLEHAEAAKVAAEELEEQAVIGAEAAVALEQQARRAAEEGRQHAEKEGEKAIANARFASSEAADALEACKAAEQRAQDAEESRSEAEIVAIEALESVEAASAAVERLAEESTGLHIALNEANQRYSALKERYAIAIETIDALKAAEARYKAEQIDLQQKLQAVQQRWKDAEEAKEIAESDAHVAMRQAQRLAEMLEQHVQHQEHPLALIYK